MFKNKIKKQKKQYLIILSLGLVFVLSGCFNKVVKQDNNKNNQPVVINESVKNNDVDDVENNKDNDFDNKIEKNNNTNTNKKDDDNDSDDGIKYDENGEIDTSDWLTYRNEELGIEFKYPDTYKKFIQKNIDNKDDGVFNGKTIFIYSEDNNLTVSLYSKDYKAFMDYPYNGNINLTTWCKNNLKVIDNYQSIGLGSIGFCDNIKIGNQNTFYETKLIYLPECSGVNMVQTAYLNLNSSDYSGLIISKRLNTITNNLNQYYDCSNNKNQKLEKIAKQYLKDIINKNNLDKKTLKELKDFQHIISTFKFTDD